MISPCPPRKLQYTNCITKFPLFLKLQFQIIIGAIPINHSFAFRYKIMVWEPSKHRCGVELGQFETFNIVYLLNKEQKVVQKSAKKCTE